MHATPIHNRIYNNNPGAVGLCLEILTLNEEPVQSLQHLTQLSGYGKQTTVTEAW